MTKGRRGLNRDTFCHRFSAGCEVKGQMMIPRINIGVLISDAV